MVTGSLATMVIGFVVVKWVGWHFSLAGIATFLGLVVYIWGQKI
jgi:dipeptide/tripeptide permease